MDIKSNEYLSSTLLLSFSPQKQSLCWIWWILQVPFLILHCFWEWILWFVLQLSINLLRFPKSSLTPPFSLNLSVFSIIFSFFSLESRPHSSSSQSVPYYYPCIFSSLIWWNSSPRPIKPLDFSVPTYRLLSISGGEGRESHNHVEELLLVSNLYWTLMLSDKPLGGFPSILPSFLSASLQLSSNNLSISKRKYRPLGTNSLTF